jgi:hypothetical protein
LAQMSAQRVSPSPFIFKTFRRPHFSP